MLSIIVLSSDGYSDCWDPFFTLFKRNFPEIEKYELILSTNEKDYDYPGLNIDTIKHGKETSWSKRLKLSIEAAKNDIIMVLVEDFFLLSKMDGLVFEKMMYLIKSDTDINHIRLLYKKGKVKTRPSRYELLDEIIPMTKYRFLFLPGLWERSTLIKYVVDFETPYMAERMGDYRSWILNDGFYALSSSYIEEQGMLFNCATSGALIKGKWAKWLPAIIEDSNIKIDFSIRGFKTPNNNKKGRFISRLDLLKNPLSTLKSISATLNLFFKK